MKVGEIYKPSEVSFEDKDTRLIIDAIRCGRVEYTNLITEEYGEISIDVFGWYYDKVEGKRGNQMNSYTFKVDFTDTVKAETEEKALDIFWEKLNYTATADLIENQEATEDD